MPECETLWLNNQLCFALYAASNAITRTYRTPLEELGLTYPQYLVIVSLLEKPSMTSGELARALKLDAGTLTPMLKRLAVSGLIERTRRTDDERVIDNRLTERGLALQQNLLRTQNDVGCRARLPASEVAALRHTLHELAANLSHNTEAAMEPA